MSGHRPGHTWPYGDLGWPGQGPMTSTSPYQSRRAEAGPQGVSTLNLTEVKAHGDHGAPGESLPVRFSSKKLVSWDTSERKRQLRRRTLSLANTRVKMPPRVPAANELIAGERRYSAAFHSDPPRPRGLARQLTL